MKIIECVPNFSEGCDQEKLKAIAMVFESFPSVRLVDYSGDSDHNRSVFTFLGESDDVLNAALAASGKALELIDMRKQAGVHPRLGAVDVVPFIPLGKTKMRDAIDLAHTFGRKLNERFGVPVYFYGHAALIPERSELANVRRGGYEALSEKMVNLIDAPDVGQPKFNPRAGATAVGAREPLVAYNINLNSDDLRLAQKIASQIREKSGGFKHLRAIGVILKSRSLAQVSMNLTNCKETPLKAIYDRVETMAAERGAEILESELIGLIPKCAFAGTKPKNLKLVNFDKDRLLETHLNAIAGKRG
jgi:glutamate formiminotransferase / 5-formyltetrahydrofolate cyclo-ligase